jgi:D-methionine transport system ATP-binding protein
MPDTLIELQSVSKTYEHDDKIITALDCISLTIECNDIYGIIGLSGAGKSTLIRCLARLVRPSSGRILFHGIDFESLSKEELRNFRKKTGMIFQHFNLLSSRTVARNIAYPLEIANAPKPEQNQRIDELLRLVGLEEKSNVYPLRLSGGEKQRVGIARALANHPELLFCDEATSALDPKTTQEILNLLRTINKKLGITIVLITHEMDVIKQICNKVAVIEQGKIVEKGLVTELFSDPKHPTTKRFLQKSSHEIPPEFFKEISAHRKLLRLTFKGKAAGEPVISELVRKFNVDANILLGWIDRLQSLTLGTLIIEMAGPPEGIKNALHFLQEKQVHVEVIEHALE